MEGWAQKPGAEMTNMPTTWEGWESRLKEERVPGYAWPVKPHGHSRRVPRAWPCTRAVALCDHPPSFSTPSQVILTPHLAPLTLTIHPSPLSLTINPQPSTLNPHRPPLTSHPNPSPHTHTRTHIGPHLHINMHDPCQASCAAMAGAGPCHANDCSAYADMDLEIGGAAMAYASSVSA